MVYILRLTTDDKHYVDLSYVKSDKKAKVSLKDLYRERDASVAKLQKKRKQLSPKDTNYDGKEYMINLQIDSLLQEGYSYIPLPKYPHVSNYWK